ncbi:T9SS type A sorting domain-containing protein [Gramella sp. AN32]|uniref:T9SS type A sorting domain-containing protein n=1 Tax=Christiangramia antarctica TaxID=2058158 RepID=A0ABW5X7B1_9FLAO|nr:T9SS type A sorting domain-containing protein [Gramella sp. AN32]MCM4158000.1 hypothetical protein [Gramella sp. AN32]
MKLLLRLLALFTINLGFAQLYVSPSNNADHFIYVKDRLVYVEKGIEMYANKNKDVEASIYLRKDAQLIQGEKNSNYNKGDGKISVFQTGTSNQYDYNFWGLPIKIPDGKNYLLNDFIYDPMGKTESRPAKLISALDGKSDPLSISDRWLYSFSGTEYSDWNYLGDNFQLQPGEGFSMKGVSGYNFSEIEGEAINTGNRQTYDFRGLPNDGNIELSIRKEQILLVGNPYPSAIDLNKFLLENTNTTGIAYFWDSAENVNSHYLADYEGGYGAYSAGTGIYIPPVFVNYGTNATGNNSGKIIPRRFAPIAQGFMIEGSNDGLVSFKNSHRIYKKQENGISEFKTSENELQSVKFEIITSDTYHHFLALAFDPNSSEKADRALDAKSHNETPSFVFWNIEDEHYVIDVRPKKDEDLIPLKISMEKNGPIEFKVNEMANFDPDRIFLYDSRDNLYFGIKTGSLKFDLSAGKYENRFFITFIENLPAVDNTSKDKPGILSAKPPNILLNTIDIFQNNALEQLEIRILYETDIKEISLFDLNGKRLFNQKFTKNEKEYYLPTGNLSNGIYIVKVFTKDKNELSKKVGVKN